MHQLVPTYVFRVTAPCRFNLALNLLEAKTAALRNSAWKLQLFEFSTNSWSYIKSLNLAYLARKLILKKSRTCHFFSFFSFFCADMGPTLIFDSFFYILFFLGKKFHWKPKVLDSGKKKQCFGTFDFLTSFDDGTPFFVNILNSNIMYTLIRNMK